MSTKRADSHNSEHSTDRSIATNPSISWKTLKAMQVTFGQNYTFTRSLGADAFVQADLYKHNATDSQVVVKTVYLPSRVDEIGTPRCAASRHQRTERAHATD